MLVFSCSSKAEINRLKDSWRAGFADKHLKTQTAPLGATSQLKKSTTATRSEFLLCLVLGILRSFMNIN